MACPITVFAFADQQKQQRDERDPGKSEQACTDYHGDDAGLGEHHHAGYGGEHPEAPDDLAIPAHDAPLTAHAQS